MKVIYDFKQLREFMDARNYPTATGSAIEIKRVDLTENESSGKIEFRNDGIYLLNNNLWQKGYMYIKDYFVAQYGLPKMHVVNCTTIREFKNNGKFDGHYFWSNEERVDVRQRNGSKVYKEVKLSLCNYCRKEIHGSIKFIDTVEFHNHLEIKKGENPVKAKKLTIDILGYTSDWKKLSRVFRDKNNYMCNVCKIDLSSDKMFLEVHHIDRIKINNNEKNLECRCIYCHVHTDDLHVNNCKKNKARVSSYNKFIERYESHLSEHYKRTITRF